MKVAVIGGGVSGMAAAYYLKQQGHTPVLIERLNTLGGRVGPDHLGDTCVELGGKNIGKRYRRFREFARSLDQFGYEHFGINTSRLEDGRIITINSRSRLQTLMKMLTGTPLRDMWLFLRLCRKVMKDPDAGFLGSAAFIRRLGRYRNSTLADAFSPVFIRRYLRPIVVRMNAAEPDEAFCCNFGSNLRVLLDSYEQLTAGMRPLLDSFAGHYPVRLATCVEHISRKESGYQLLLTDMTQQQTELLDVDGVIIATPANQAANLLGPLHSSLARRLSRVRYFPVTVIIAEYEQAVFTMETRALVFGPESALSNAGAYAVDQLNIVRYTFSGRNARQYLGENSCAESLLDMAEAQLAPHFTINGNRRIRHVARHWPLGLCAYSGDTPLLVRESANTGLPALAITGDYISGASIESCFHAAEKAVHQLTQGEHHHGEAEILSR